MSLSNKNSIDGIIPVLKPRGFTSHDVVAKLRKILKTKSIGHTGTLDPEVIGVLPICIGKATRIAEYITDLPKTYVGQMALGISTSTEDATGEILEVKEVKEDISIEKIETVFQSFIGEIDQVPPMYSSVKVNGKRLYELARKGEVVERQPRKVKIYSLKLTNYIKEKNPKIDFEVSCSKGTYVRTLCVDLGKKLGYPAHMSNLIRTKSGSFDFNHSFSIEQIEEMTQKGTIDQMVVSMSNALPQFPEIHLSDDMIQKKVYNGQRIEVELSSYEGLIKVIDGNGKLAALYEKKKLESIAIPKKVFKED